MNKLLIIGGPTSTGKTALALSIAQQYNGEIISSDSRQVFIGMDIVTGKDIPKGYTKSDSELVFMNKKIPYYGAGPQRVWLTDLVYPNESFNVSFFNQAAHVVIQDCHNREKLPIIVGATGLYTKSLTHNLTNISIPINPELRNELRKKTSAELFHQLQSINPSKALSLNNSDKNNPRRLIRAIEISTTPTLPNDPKQNYDLFGLYLQGPQALIYERIDKRVIDRVHAGAEQEVRTLLSQGYDWDLPSMQTTGYKVWQPYIEGKYGITEVITNWQIGEHHDYRQQSIWFKNQFPFPMIDVSEMNWQEKVGKRISDWYNKDNQYGNP